MLLIVNNAEEEASAWRALEVINSLRARPGTTVKPAVGDAPWIHTRWANKKYL